MELGLQPGPLPVLQTTWLLLFEPNRSWGPIVPVLRVCELGWVHTLGIWRGQVILRLRWHSVSHLWLVSQIVKGKGFLSWLLPWDRNRIEGMWLLLSKEVSSSSTHSYVLLSHTHHEMTPHGLPQAPEGPGHWAEHSSWSFDVYALTQPRLWQIPRSAKGRDFGYQLNVGHSGAPASSVCFLGRTHNECLHESGRHKKCNRGKLIENDHHAQSIPLRLEKVPSCGQ